MNVRNPIAIRKNTTEVVMISDIDIDTERGLKCNCVCPDCTVDFIARMGEINQHHFAHSSKGCDEAQAYIKGIYLLLKEIVEEKSKLMLPPLYAYYNFSPYMTKGNLRAYVWSDSRKSKYRREEMMIFDSISLIFDSAEIEYERKNPAALVLTCKNSKLAIVVAPPNTICKTYMAEKYKDMATLEIDFRNKDEWFHSNTTQEIKKRLLSSYEDMYWIYNNKIEDKFDSILEANDKNNKRIEEEHKRRVAAEEYRKQIAEEMRKKRMEEERKAQIEKDERKKRMEEEERKKEQERKIIDEQLAYQDVKDKFTQQHTPILDRNGKRWIKCRICNEIKRDYEFGDYGGENEVNLGKCNACYENK